MGWKAFVLSGALTLGLAGGAVDAAAETLRLEPASMTEWKAVYGRVEARDSVPARARLGGTIIALNVTEGDTVKAGDVLALVKDDKIDFQIAATNAQLSGLQASLANAQSELTRGEQLLKSGVTTTQRLDQLRTQVDVIANQIGATEAQRAVIEEQAKEGQVLAPVDGKVLTVPVTRGAVALAGETIATVGGGGFFLRLAIPERHAATLKQGAAIEIDGVDGTSATEGRLAKIYPEIDNGRVIADVEVADLPTAFVNARVLVRLPVGSHEALLVPQAAIVNRFGVDYVSVIADGVTSERAVVIGQTVSDKGKDMVEILTGLAAGEEVQLP
ncbi:efflux RND transporter periplasmic adaptor subunit [Rhizobium sp. NRK18]|uniref:efflux RND transporter periplasmic adaptor subunit n=1 Tax=Rhizobium sp. NRK18 TaxID=2964667 RepID=UPI0021C2767D|nr:efflux RND transporter periplasmic adaptor subunit [Rhizobium sp. NRK18]MCQ2005713.1 efflux RND transporter periplasmic adaptor subunit [Rhizobium sp. NRK18]